MNDWKPIENSLREMVRDAHTQRLDDGNGTGALTESIANGDVWKMNKDSLVYGTDLPYASHYSWHRKESGLSQLIISIAHEGTEKFVDYIITGKK